jgi:hypothetical protein
VTVNEARRLAVVETKVDSLVAAVERLDVRVQALGDFMTAVQARDVERERRSAFWRWLFPFVVTVVNVSLAFYAVLGRV